MLLPSLVSVRDHRVFGTGYRPCGAGRRSATSISRTPVHTVQESMREALLFVIVVAMVATGLWLFVTGLFFESETNIWYVVSGGWLTGLDGDRLWRDFVAPFLGFEEV
jgi:hypothetical protein